MNAKSLAESFSVGSDFVQRRQELNSGEAVVAPVVVVHCPNLGFSFRRHWSSPCHSGSNIQSSSFAWSSFTH